MTCVEFAKQEFDLLGWPGDDEMQQLMCENILELLDAFDKQGHSGFSANYAISYFTRLAKYEPISPLTGDDSEWIEIGDNKYQNKRCFSVFKDENGAYNIDGKVFREKDGSCFTNYYSRVEIAFPYIPKTEYVDV